MRYAIAFILAFSAATALAQGTHVELRSSPLHLRIMADTIPPVISLNPFRAIEPGYKFRVRDSVLWVTGSVSDLDGVSSLQVGDQSVPNFHGGKFAALVHLMWGKNLVPIRSLDRKRNVRDTVLIIYRELRADTTAPTIDITEPFKGRGIRLLQKTTTLRVAGTVRDDSTIAAVYVNEHRVDSIAGGFWHYTLPTDSLNAIYVKAVDSSGNVAFDSLILPPHAFTLEPETVPIPVSGKFFALLIGVQKYRLPGIQDLKNPVHDAESLEEILNARYTFDSDNITVLKNPSRDKIMETFEKLHGVIKEEDNFLIFYAGHGYLDKDAHQGYWWPSDASSANPSHWISNADLRDQIKRIKAKHTLLISDACFSGSVFRTSRGGQMDNADIPTLEAYKRRSRTALTSGEEDVPDESVFTRYLIDILKTNEARQFRTISLYGALHDEVISNSPNRQSVEYGVIQEAEDMGGGDFVFIKRANEPR
jgi:hypothetical protein